MEGKVFRGFKVEANEFISMYDFESLNHNYYVIDFLESEGKCDEDECPFSSCNLCGELDEVIITNPPDVPIIYPGNGGGGSPPSGDPLPNLPGGGGGGANDGSCPPGEIKDELGNCIEPPEDGGVYIIGECPDDGDDGLSMAGVCLELKCPDGFYKNFEGDCILTESCATNDEIINSQSIQSAFEDLWESSGALSPDIPMESRLEDGGWIIQNGGSYEFVSFDSSWTRTPCGIDPPENWTSTIPSNLIGVVHTHPFYLGEDRRSICDRAEEEYIGGPSDEDYFFLTQVMNEVNDYNLLGYIVDGDLITSFDFTRTINLQTYQRCGY
ncbi:hypothetical protein [Psychroflexus montanilacus]|uniref:hypothetical protein n=1 Tax=Psychroflexus montanilacus TaxID=2873598 RepID=UPI001CCD05AA|nr:hypothetical protein [Psychroflexus montanilacus]MBZ9652202.1 hypothetical protein [Psychroflexus montanilacus]